MRLFVWVLVLLLIFAHQDTWNWSDDRLVLGMPIGLTYHIGLSIVTALVWAFVCFFAWPKDLDELAEEESSHSDSAQLLEGGN